MNRNAHSARFAGLGIASQVVSGPSFPSVLLTLVMADEAWGGCERKHDGYDDPLGW